MVALAVEDIDLFKIACCSISGWIPSLKDAPFAIGYTFEGQPHHYLPDVVGSFVLSIPAPALPTQVDEHTMELKSHDKRKIRTPNTTPRWAMGETTWEVVGGERT